MLSMLIKISPYSGRLLKGRQAYGESFGIMKLNDMGEILRHDTEEHLTYINI